MKTKPMHMNSIFAWKEYVKPTRIKRQQEVLNVYEYGGGFTDEDVAQKLGLPINKISGRVGELIKLGKIRELKKEETKIRGRRVCVIN